MTPARMSFSVVRADREVGSSVLFRRDGHFADMITAELAGSFEAPIYGMLAVNRAIAAARLGSAAAAGDQPARAAHRRVETIAAVGRRVGDYLGAASVWQFSASTSWWSRSSAASSCRW